MRLYKNGKIVRAFCVTTLVALFLTGCNSSGNSKEYVVVNPNKSEQSVEEDTKKNPTAATNKKTPDSSVKK